MAKGLLVGWVVVGVFAVVVVIWFLGWWVLGGLACGLGLF